MSASDKKFCTAGVFWLVIVAVLTTGGTERWLDAQLTPLAAIELEEPIDGAGGGEDAPPAMADPEQLEPPASPEVNIITPAQPPLEIRISGPVDSLVGDMVELHAETTQDVTQFAWSIQPPVRGLIVLDEGTKAVFAHRDAGDYLVIVSTANAAGQVAHATMPFTLRPAPPENPLTVESLAEANPPPDLRDLIRRWAAEVVTNNRTGEAAAVASSLRAVATLLQTNKLASNPNADPLFEAERAAEQTLGPAAFAKWEIFFKRVRDFLYPLSVRGYITSPVQYANTFNNLAAELEAISAGR
jgi:hypothetical protein